MLEDKYKEKETVINLLEQDKSKLETFTKRTLAHFREKFMQSLETVRQEKATLENQLQEVILRYQTNKNIAEKEEKLIMSAMYEIGLRTIDASINEQLGKLVT